MDDSNLLKYSDADLVGKVLGRDYLVEERIGKGGMAWVYRATHRRLGGEVAIKVLFSQLVDVYALHVRFVREAQSQYSLNHPNIVRVFDFIEEQGIVGFVSEWCDGGELSERIPIEEHLSFEMLKTLIFPILDAMQYAHNEGIIHRDLKPQNILIQTRGGNLITKVTDFGIAKFRQEQIKLTSPGMMVGTLQYMSPEQLRNKEDLDHRCDIYSLGVILYQMLSGHLPFEGEAMPLIMNILEQTPPPLSEQHVPTPLAEVVMRCLSKHPECRYSSCSELKEALSEALEGVPISDVSSREEVLPSEQLEPLALECQTKPSKQIFFEQEEPDILRDDDTLLEEFQQKREPLPETKSSESLIPKAIYPEAKGTDSPSHTKTLPPRICIDPEWTPSAKESVARSVPVELTSKGTYQRKYQEPGASGGWGNWTLLGLFLLFCGLGAGGFIMYDLRFELGWPAVSEVLGQEQDAGKQMVDHIPERNSRSVGIRDAEVSSVRLHPDTHSREHQTGQEQAPCSTPIQCYKRGLSALEKLDEHSGGEAFRSARSWVIKTCEMSYTPACLKAGDLFHFGPSGERDDLKARMFYQQACERGSAMGCYQLARLLRLGFGGLRDLKRAATFYNRACRGKLGKACRWAGKAAAKGWSGPSSCSKANKLYQKACHELQDQKACKMECE